MKVKVRVKEEYKYKINVGLWLIKRASAYKNISDANTF